MSVVNNPLKVRKIYRQAGLNKIALATFCTESERMTEAILEGVLEFGKEIGVADLPVCIAVTGKYPYRSQILNFTYSRNYKLGFGVFFNHIYTLMSPVSPYKSLRLLTHLDHAFPDLDKYAFNNYTDQFSTIMFDASGYTLLKNIELTKKYVKKYHNSVVIEGCVDTIGKNRKKPGSGLTSLIDAQRFKEETKVNLMVVNVGTEHRVTEGERKYYATRVREISSQVGPVLVLHGASCLNEKELTNLANDGIVKVNLYTALEQLGSTAVLKHSLNDLGNILGKKDIEDYIQKNILGEYFLNTEYITRKCHGRIMPRLTNFSENIRRDVYVTAVKKLVKKYLKYFGYKKFAAIKDKK